MVGVANWPLCEVVHYCAGLNGTKVHVSVRYIEGVYNPDIQNCLSYRRCPLSGVPLYMYDCDKLNYNMIVYMYV